MIQVILTRLDDFISELEGSQVLGRTRQLPEPGKSFHLESFDFPKEGPLLQIPQVKSVREHFDFGSLEFESVEGYYGLQILDLGVKDTDQTC